MECTFPPPHPTSSSYHHLVGIFPRCHPPKWDSVWGLQGSWHNLNVANFTGQRSLQQCEPNRSGTTCPQYSLVGLAGCANLWGRTWGSGRNLGQNITLAPSKGSSTHEWRALSGRHVSSSTGVVWRDVVFWAAQAASPRGCPEPLQRLFSHDPWAIRCRTTLLVAHDPWVVRQLSLP